jgi:2-keto-4-pentenoate hydratase/2-oxohepta-3-ene-1,7-dioic acid hydratase in catechol pathway
MRLIGYRWHGRSHIGAVRGDAVTPLAPVPDFYTDVTAMLRAAAAAEANLPLDGLEPAPFVPETAKVFCVGLNYRRHAAEAGRQLPDAPNLFGRWASTLVCHGEPVPVPAAEPALDWEGELAAVVGSPVRAVTPEAGLASVLGYACFNDLTARRHQQATPQWTLGKNADRSAPIGPVLVTADEVPDPGALAIQTRVNGEVVQRSSTADMIFSPGEIVAYISGVATLRPGDVIATGTPEGVGFHRRPPRLLGPGDVVEVEIDGLGVLRNPIIAAQAAEPVPGPAPRLP